MSSIKGGSEAAALGAGSSTASITYTLPLPASIDDKTLATPPFASVTVDGVDDRDGADARRIYDNGLIHF